MGLQRSQDLLPICINESSWVGFRLLWNSPQCDRTSAETIKVPDTIFTNGSHNLSFEASTTKSIALLQQILRPIGYVFSSYGCGAAHSGTLKTRKRLGRDIQSVTAPRMEQVMWEPDSIILSSITQIYCRRWTQTVFLYRLPLPPQRPIQQHYTSTLQ